jgi:hypothetical protein
MADIEQFGFSAQPKMVKNKGKYVAATAIAQEAYDDEE